MSTTAEPASAAAGAARTVPPTCCTARPRPNCGDAVRSLLADRAGWRDVLARTETSETYDTALWQVLAAEVGCAGLLIPEARGGAGARYREAAVVAEETGRAVAPVPYLGSAVVATTALLAGRDAELLAGLAAGTLTAALAVPFASRRSAASPPARRPGWAAAAGR